MFHSFQTSIAWSQLQIGARSLLRRALRVSGGDPVIPTGRVHENTDGLFRFLVDVCVIRVRCLL